MMILVELLAAASLSPATLLLTQAAVPPEPPKTRRVCRDVAGAYTRTPKRVCTNVTETQTAAPRPPAAVIAPLATTFGVGMAVVDTQGGAVGTITAVGADTVTVKTAKHQAALPKTSLTISEGKALFGLSQADLDASIERTLAAAPGAGLKVGAAVKGKDGGSVGTVDLVAADNVTIRLSDGQKISIPRSGIGVDADGSGLIGLTSSELMAQIKAARPAN